MDKPDWVRRRLQCYYSTHGHAAEAHIIRKAAEIKTGDEDPVRRAAKVPCLPLGLRGN